MEPYGNQWEPMESHGNEIKAKVWESMGVHANQLEPNGNECTIRVVGDSADPERPHTPGGRGHHARLLAQPWAVGQLASQPARQPGS